MSTTSIRLPDTLKQRVADAADRAGTSAHAFIVEAVREKTLAEEARHDFHGVAEQRYEEILASGKSIPWNDMRSYLLQRAQSTACREPVPKKLP